MDNQITLNNGCTIRAELYDDNPDWQCIDIVIRHPDGVEETICCADYDKEKGLLRALVFNQGDCDEPVFDLDYMKGC